ncbi:MAG: leucine-rich repeat domain-containing protein [Oscillospiraceae bacterium]|nr:leucine-rich repeat domain-containing protein [Oscillospiraceae bacterium]
MNKQRLAAVTAGLLGALLTAAGTAAPCRAIWDDIVLDDEQDKETFISGEYEYSIMLGVEDETKKAACIEKYTGEAEDLVIPSELDGLEVVMFGNYAFANNQKLHTVTLPASVLGFGKYTFADCRYLTEYRVAEGNTFCKSRNGILYSADDKALIRYPIGKEETSFEVEEGIIGIGNSAFAGDKYLTDLKLPSTLEEFGIASFADCDLLNNVVVPDKVTEIPDYCFNNCRHMTNITLPDGITAIGNAAFTSVGITSIDLPESLVSIGQQAFADSKLTEVTIPARVTSIGYSAFGWKLNALGELVMDSGFIIRGYKGTIAQRYCVDSENENNFTFIALEEPAETESPAETKQKTSAVKIIAVIVGCLLLAAVIAAAVISELRRKQRIAEASKKKKKKKKPASGQKQEPAEVPAAEELPADGAPAAAETVSDAAEPDEGRGTN